MKTVTLVNIWLMQLKLFFMYFHFFFFFSILSESLNIFRVFTQWPLTFLPVSCRIDVGHNDYGYQQPSYPEQGYDRPYEDSSQHYYEGGIYIPSHTYIYIPFYRNENSCIRQLLPMQSSCRILVAGCLKSYREPKTIKIISLQIFKIV